MTHQRNYIPGSQYACSPIRLPAQLVNHCSTKQFFVPGLRNKNSTANHGIVHILDKT